jgi:hypothetical protein
MLKPETSKYPRKLTHSKYSVPNYQIMPECENAKVQTGCNPISSLFGISGYPVTLVIGKNGIVRYNCSGFATNSKGAEELVKSEYNFIEKLINE